VEERRFLDCHSHVVPSGDDGVGTIAEGAALCRGAAERGTAVLYATPHVWPHLQLSEKREAAIREAFAELVPQAPLDLRLGFELTPTAALLDEDPRRFVLDGLDAVLIEVPFVGSPHLLWPLCEQIEEAELTPVIAHPERTEAVLEEPKLADDLAERGWLLQVNSTSLLGRHGPDPAALAWDLLDRGVAALVGSDGHRTERPPYLDEAYRLARARLGERALRFFDGSALEARSAAGISSPRPASPAAPRGA
jgi:protein-tyrosine phosphatase